MGKYHIFIVNQLVCGPILVLEDVHISFFLFLSLYPSLLDKEASSFSQ